MKPAMLLALVIVGLAAFFMLRDNAPEVFITDATLTPMGNGHALTLSIDNPGTPDRVDAVTIKAAPTMLSEAGPLIVPGGDTASLAMDGAHGMVMGLQGAVGELVPVSVYFAEAGVVKTRARIADGAAMDHDVLYEVPPEEPQPSLSITATPDESGWRLRLTTTDFTFDQDGVDGAHVPGTGHGHVYLNGLKLGRVYSDEFEIGALPKGTHDLSVALNTNDHRGYAVDGIAVQDSVEVTVD